MIQPPANYFATRLSVQPISSNLRLFPAISGSILLIIFALSALHLLLPRPHAYDFSATTTPSSPHKLYASDHACRASRDHQPFLSPPVTCDHDSESRCSARPARAHDASIVDYGGLGDGVSMNTPAFERAIAHLSTLAGGAQLYIPPGRWLTGCFHLTSHLTLLLHKDAFILGSQDPGQWPLIEPLPSYGSGRERPGKRHCSLVHGENLTDVWITGDNGTIDGQGWAWWEMWRNRSLEHTRGHLVEFISSEDIVISNVVLRNSPFWTVHPIYCNNVIVKNVTIIAPWNAPNTDGIDPDSTSNVCIEDCYISNGDDLIAIKSGWDGYGMHMACPSVNITIRRVSGTTRTCSGISFGSEVSGGISNVRVEDVHIFNSSYGLRLKTAPGRGGFITNITLSNISLTHVKQAIVFTGDSGEHPPPPSSDPHPHDFSLVSNIFVRNVVGSHTHSPGRFWSVPESPFRDICLFNISLDVASPSWLCSHAFGSSYLVSPQLCPPLENSSSSQACYSNYR